MDRMDHHGAEEATEEAPALRQIVERDLRDQASVEERDHLRREDNLNPWREELGKINTSVEAQLAARKKRLKERESLAERNPDNPEVVQAYLHESEQYESWRSGVLRFKETVETRLAENKELRKARHEYLMAGGSHRELLLKARSFLATDEAIAYSYLPARDELLEEIDRGLYGDEDEESL